MKTYTYTAQFTAPHPDKLVPAILVQGGYKTPEQANDAMHRKAEEMARRVLSLPAPRSIISQHPFVSSGNGVLKVSSAVLKSAKLYHLTQHYESPAGISVFVATLGHGFDREMKKIMEGSMLESLFLDAAGSVLIEHYVGLIEEEVKRRFATEGLEASLRFSPGYCDWETGEGQKALFSLIDAESIGVKINEYGMMTPIKSVSGIILGAGRISHRTPCPYCGKQDCPHRRESRSDTVV